MIPQEKIEQAFRYTRTANDLLSFSAGVRFAEAEMKQPDKDEFIKYCKEARTEFVVKFWEYHQYDTRERVMAEDLLIAYDQLLNRYNQ